MLVTVSTPTNSNHSCINLRKTNMTSITIYQNLCNSRKINKPFYKKGSGLHEHHIIPSHSGGLDEDENYTYLTTREHTIAHYLLWRINKNPNDLRSMKMLGANLSVAYRKIIGRWCVENKIGFHNDKFTKEERLEWSLKGLETQKESGNKDSFHYWSTQEGQKERASLGGKAGGASQLKERGFIACTSLDPIERSLQASKASLLSPKKPITNGVINKKLFTDEEVNSFIENNPEWRRGQTLKNKKLNLYSFKDPNGVLHENFTMKYFCDTFNLTSSGMRTLHRKKVKSSRGWTNP